MRKRTIPAALLAVGLMMTPMDLDARLGSGDEWLDGKSVTAWYRAKQLLGLG